MPTEVYGGLGSSLNKRKGDQWDPHPQQSASSWLVLCVHASLGSPM